MQFAPTASTDSTMTLPAGYSYLKINQDAVTFQRLNTLSDASIKIAMNAMTTVASFGAAASLLALLAFN